MFDIIANVALLIFRLYVGIMVGYENRENESSLSESALAGGVSGAITRLVLHPLDVIKTRFQVIQ